jgi:hypothetical protein
VSVFRVELSHPEERGRLAMWLQLAGLLTAGFLVAQASPFLHWVRLSLPHLVLQSAALTTLAWMSGAGVTLGLYFVCDQMFFQNWDTGEIARAVMRTAGTAVWFVPAVVLNSALHPGALVAALVLVHHVTRLLYWQWQESAKTAARPPEEAAGLFASSTAGAPPLLRRLSSRLLVSGCLQASLVAAIMHDYGLARLLFYASTAMITMLVMGLRDYRPETGSSIWRSAAGLVFSLLLAGGLTVTSLAPRARGGTGGQSDQNGAPGPPAFGEVPGIPKPTGNARNESFPTDSFPGVILWPEVKPVPMLIAPVPTGHGGMATSRPLGIPFAGQYWMYRWPYARPPVNSISKRGNPAKLSFRTTDHRPLQMEAHHKLDQAIDIGCCSQIQVTISNAEHRAGAISLELVLLNTETRPARKQSMGTAMVTPGSEGGNPAYVLQTLQFFVPSSGSLDEFNEFQVNFIRDPQRMDASAKIAIERFILIPR